MRSAHAAGRSRRAFGLRAGVATVFALAACSAFAAPSLEGVKLPPGFQIEVYTDQVPLAREMAFGPKGTLFVGSLRAMATPSADKVYAVRTVNGKRVVTTLLKGLNNPNGVAVRDGALYVAEVNRITRYDDIEAHLDKPPKGVEIAKLPPEQHHGWRYIAFGPDGKLYVPIGGPCNVCDKDKDGYAQILRMNADGSGREIIAHGVRNSVGFAWQPDTDKFYFTDNGRDMLGDNVPDCELNRLDKIGAHFGFPYCHAGSVVDPEFGTLGSCASAVAPVQKLGPHVAPLAVRFYTGAQFPAEYKNTAFIAQHGSWNRSTPIGYRIMQVKLDGDRVASYEPFLTGWLSSDGTKVSGRPVDLQLLPDGSMLVSDDQEGAIYRISYKK
ncbi:MAG TPA: PQQ-dependent sugar dehydrogenase [Steroidobacteraceae bacterium]|jgi:glucose/arabinose dehydrogenase|nr:PQQ-dependent sugar dehydrogenase [Steroidobacteraceae bacterium]